MPREVSFTSRLAYERICADGLLPPARLKTYDLTYRIGPVTARQVDDALGRDYHKRLPELVAQGVLQQVGTTTCPVTGQLVTQWDITDRLPVPLPKPPKGEALTGRAKAVAEIKRRIPEKKRSLELRQLLAELEVSLSVPFEPDDYEPPESMFDD